MRLALPSVDDRVPRAAFPGRRHWSYAATFKVKPSTRDRSSSCPQGARQMGSTA